jgi:hypothetical protein
METTILLNGVSGSGSSDSYSIQPKRGQASEVQVFLTFSAGTITLEASADSVNFAPIRDGQFTSSEVVPLDLADGSLLRISYSGATGLNAIVTPKESSNA